jgi:hypothetical protein
MDLKLKREIVFRNAFIGFHPLKDTLKQKCDVFSTIDDDTDLMAAGRQVCSTQTSSFVLQKFARSS